MSKTCVRGGVGHWGIIDRLSGEGGHDRGDLIRGWSQQAAESGQEGADGTFSQSLHSVL